MIFLIVAIGKLLCINIIDNYVLQIVQTYKRTCHFEEVVGISLLPSEAAAQMIGLKILGTFGLKIDSTMGRIGSVISTN